MILAWRLAKTENKETVRLVIGDMVERQGIPDRVTLDNGRAFASKWITGRLPNRIESGKVDLQLSSLIQPARLLDLEVKLVPKNALPVVDSVIRSTAPQAPSKKAASALNKLRQAETVTETLREALPDDSELRRA